MYKLGVALNLKSQATAVKINRNIWSLTKDSVDDNATVRLVTIVTLIYLPASFVAVSIHWYAVLLKKSCADDRP